MKNRMMVVGLVLAAAMTARANFTLVGTDQMTVSTNLGSSSSGSLYDQSQADIVSGGYVMTLTASDSSTATVFGGRVWWLRAYRFSRTTVSDGEVDRIHAYNSSTVSVSGGYVGSLQTLESSRASVSGGRAAWLEAYDSSTASVSGGIVDIIYAMESSTVTVSGGRMGDLGAWNFSTVLLNGRDFVYGNGLTFDSSTHRVLGTGTLSGRWFDGTAWSVDIIHNDPTATILAVPEPASMVLLALGGVGMLRRRKS